MQSKSSEPDVSRPGCGGGCGQTACEGLTDTDGDYVRDGLDNCPTTYNYSQLDADGDGTGDVCDADPCCGGEGLPAKRSVRCSISSVSLNDSKGRA